MAFKAGIWGEAHRRGLAPHDILSWWPRCWLQLQQETEVGGPGTQECGSRSQNIYTFWCLYPVPLECIGVMSWVPCEVPSLPSLSLKHRCGGTERDCDKKKKKKRRVSQRNRILHFGDSHS